MSLVAFIDAVLKRGIGFKFQVNVLLEKMPILGIRAPKSDGTVLTG